MNQKEFIYNQLLLEYHLISRKILDIEQLYANHNKEQLEELSNLKKRQNLIKVEFENLFKIKPTPRKVIGKKVTVPEKKPQIIKKEKTRWEIYVETCKSLTPKLSKDFPKIDKNSYKKSLLIETRKLDHNEFVIKNTIQKLGDGWGHIIYCHKDNYDQIKKICDDVSSDIEIRLLDFTLTRNSYNNLCLDINFWNEIDCKKVLVYQTDTLIFKNFDDKFLEYDWIGDVWSDGHTKFIKNKLGWDDLWGCNGGLNLRSVPAIKEILENQEMPKINFGDMEKIPEDTFFSWYIKNNYKFPAREFCEEFSSQKNFNENTFGTHQPKFKDFDEFKNIILNIYN